MSIVQEKKRKWNKTIDNEIYEKDDQEFEVNPKIYARITYNMNSTYEQQLETCFSLQRTILLWKITNDVYGVW